MLLCASWRSNSHVAMALDMATVSATRSNSPVSTQYTEPLWQKLFAVPFLVYSSALVVVLLAVAAATAASACCQLMCEELHKESNTLMVVSSYHIGKERAYLGAAAALGLKVRCTPPHLLSGRTPAAAAVALAFCCLYGNPGIHHHCVSGMHHMQGCCTG